MKNSTKLNQSGEKPLLTINEEVELDGKVELELHEMQCKMAKMSVVVNSAVGFLFVWFLYGKEPLFLLVSWYIALVAVNIFNSSFAFYYAYKKVPPHKIKPWRNGYHFFVGLVCIVWGAIGILFISPSNIHDQLFVVTFLLSVLVAFGFGTMTDFTASLVCISCLLVPYLIFQAYSKTILGSNIDANFGFSIALLCLGTFLLIASYIGYRLIKKFFKLSFVNVALSGKLENMNKFLEQRVAERTQELEESLKMVTYQATHDLLTDLPNRRLLFDYMRDAIKSANQYGHMFAVVFFSLNEIEKINDALGHQISDQVIHTIAQRFQKICANDAPGDIQVARYMVTLSRRDEFVILIEPILQLDQVETMAEVLFSVLDEPIRTKKQALKLTASIGVSVYPRHGSDIKTLFMNADAARTSKKIGGNSLSVYQAAVNADLYKQLELECDLHTAVRNNEFILQYQPFVDLKTGQICGMEALVRWIHPTLGYVPPMDFIQLAESNGVILPLGEWVLRSACIQTKNWHQQGFTELKVSVNLSARQLRQKTIIQTIANILKETNLAPEYLELELTETEAFKNDVIPILKELTQMGLSLSIDDFGTGYSGLTNLKLLTIGKLKIDKSFVQDIDTSDDSKAIVSNTIALAKKLNITTLAEGVETKEQLKFLRENGCEMVQGYYFSRPVDVEAFTNLLTAKRGLSSEDLEGQSQVLH